MSEKIEYVELRFVDLPGRLKGMTVPCKPAETIEELKKDPNLKKGTSVDGSSIIGLSRVESSDLRLEPDMSTLIEIPYASQRIAAAMCFVKDKMVPAADQKYYPKDTRATLHSVCERYLPGNLHLKVKIEPEFHIITTDGDPFDLAGYADTFPTSPGSEILLEMASAVKDYGMRPRVIHHEVGESQQEIEIDYADVRKMAELVLLFKNLARAITQNYGLDVSFMPKPFAGSAGNGLHCHMQLWDGDRNLFGTDKGDDLSETGKMFVAGLLHHAPAITALANPSVNSYKRLVPHYEAPVYISWGLRNRTVLIRVPQFSTRDKAAIEFRSPDATTNPYLLFSAVIAAGMDGVKRELKPPEPRSEDVFHITDEERENLGIGTLPLTLDDALNHLEECNLMKEALGSELFETYLKVKREEWMEYQSFIVTEFEWEKYHNI